MLKVFRISMLFSSVAVATIAQGAEFEVHPSLAVKQEYTDNVFETRTNRVSDHITRALPGIVMTYKAPAFTGDLNYLFDYRYYARKSREDEITHNLAANGYLIAIENFAYLDVSDHYQRVSLDVSRDVSEESLYLNQSDRNIASVSPYLKFNLTDRTMLKTGYRFVDTRYFDSPAINKMDHIGFADLTHLLSERFSISAGYIFTRELAEMNDFDQHLVYGGFRYEYAEKSFVFVQGGNVWTKYENRQRLNSLFWNAGISHTMDSVTASVTTGKHYVEDPLRSMIEETFVTGVLEKRFDRGVVSISPIYSEYVRVESDDLYTRKYGATARGQYSFTEDLSGTASFSAEKYEQPQLGSYTRRFLVTSGLSYRITEHLTASAYYNYVDYYSPGIVADNRHVNRGMVELKLVF